jgi:hypothetical protein
VGGMAQALECLTSKHEALTSNSSATKKEIKHFFLSFINIPSFFGQILLLDIFLKSRPALTKQAPYHLKHTSIHSISMLGSFLSSWLMLAFN